VNSRGSIHPFLDDLTNEAGTMVQINFARKEINCKLVYYGPGMSGKTTNLEMVHKKTPEVNKGELTSISTDGDRTLFFDFMPLDLGEIAGMKTKFHLYTVPGQVYYNSTRKLVLNGADGVIFVADSSRAKLQENKESLENLRENLAEIGKDYAKFPIILQFNKRDMPDAMTVEELQRELNPLGFPTAEAIAAKGEGVFQTLKHLSAKVLASINSTERIGLSGAALGASRGSIAPGDSARGAAVTNASPLKIERNEVGATTCQSPPAPRPQPSAPVERAPVQVAASAAPPRAPAAPPRAPAATPSVMSAVAPRPLPAAQSEAARVPSNMSSRVTAIAEPERSVAPDVQMASSMSRRVSATRGAAPTSLSQGVRVIGAPMRREVHEGGSAKAFIALGVIVAIAAGAATWFFLR
jgi:mutual gliding-motility protein MglA